MPRRVTSYRSSSPAGPAALVAVLTLIVAGFVWVFDPGLFGLPAVAIASLNPPPRLAVSTATDGGGSPDAAPAQAPNAPNAAPVLRMADVVTPAATTVATSTPVATLRQWDTSSPGVVIDPALVGRLDEALAGVDGQISVAVKDLGTGRGAALDGDREMPAASIFKLEVLYSVFDAGLGMGEELLITDEMKSYDLGTLELGAGESLSVAEALERMVTISDNTSAVMLAGRVGPGRVIANNAALGLDSTHYSLERLTTSAEDMLHLLDLVAHGKAVSAGASADMVHLLLRQRVNDRLPRLLPSDVQVAHKTGNLPGTVNDVGIVYGPSSTVAVAVLISETTDETAAATAIARVAQTAYAYFEDEPEVTGRPTIPRAPARAIPPVWRQPRPPPPTPTVEPTALPEPTPVEPVIQTVVQPTPVAILVRTATAAPTQSPPTATPAPRPATATAVPTRAPTRPPAATATPARR